MFCLVCLILTTQVACKGNFTDKPSHPHTLDHRSGVADPSTSEKQEETTTDDHDPISWQLSGSQVAWQDDYAPRSQEECNVEKERCEVAVRGLVKLPLFVIKLPASHNGQ